MSAAEFGATGAGSPRLHLEEMEAFGLSIRPACAGQEVPLPAGVPSARPAEAAMWAAGPS